jgi:hypothetical protein
MVQLVPDEPRFANTTEQLVWERLRDGLGAADVLLANVRLTDEDKDHEADLVVLMPDIGIVVIEVKGGSVWHDGESWKQGTSRRSKRIDPVSQARGVKYAIRDYVAADPRWGRRNHVAWGHAVVTPSSDFPQEFATPDCPRWSLHDRGDQADLVDRIRVNATRARQGKQPPTVAEVELVLEVLAGRMPTSYDVNADSDERSSVADRLTQEQASILDVTRLLHRVEVRGGAGSGKTVLALQQAKQLTRGRHDKKAQRVALLCYSLGLAEHLKRTVATWHRKERPAFVGTFHEFGKQWGAGDPPEPRTRESDTTFFEDELPRTMAELAMEQPDGTKYDAVIVDEAQDFADSWWRPVLAALRDEDEGGLYAYSDENQRLFARFGRPPVQLVPLVLDHNLRNTRQIHESFGPLAPFRMYARGGEGPSVRFVACATDEAISSADDEVDRLLDSGWRQENVCLLTTGHRHPVQVERTDFHDQDGYWRSFWDTDDVFYGHVLGCKGLERRAVVLCVNESGDRDRARERLYVGMSRATDELVVVGDPAVIRAVGGEQVARRLGI